MKRTKIAVLCAILALLGSLLIPMAVYGQNAAETGGTPIAISGLADSTLTKVRGKPESGSIESTPVTVTDEGFRLSFHSYNPMAGDKAIAFASPITEEDLAASGGLSVRMYVHLSQSSPFYIRGEDYGIFFYGLGEGIDGSAEDTFVELPQDIRQDEWINFEITALSAMRLLGTDEMLAGLQYAAHIQVGNGNSDYFYIGEPKHGRSYILIESVSLLDKKYDTDPLAGGTYLAGARENDILSDDNENWNGPLKMVNGYTQNMNIWEEWHERPIRINEDSSAANGRVYTINFHSWSPVVSNNVILFSTPVSAAETGGLLIRIKAHLSPSTPYDTAYGGIRFYALDAEGRESEGYMLPADITQDSWITLRLTAAEAQRLANKDGMIYGLQIASALRVGTTNANTLYIGESASYIKIDYIASCEEVSLTYCDYDGQGNTKTVSVITGYNYESNYYYPAPRAGYLFAGWYEGQSLTEFTGEPFDFSSVAAEDLWLTARWIKLCDDVTEYYGIYTKENERIALTEHGLEITGGQAGYFEDWGVGADGCLFVVTSERMREIDLSEYEKKAYYTVTYNSFGEDVLTQVYAEDEPVAMPELAPSGYRLEKWYLQEEGENSPAFVFGDVLTENITLCACWERIDLSEEQQAEFSGTYYNAASDTLFMLGSYHSASLIYADGTREDGLYYVLEGGGFAWLPGGETTHPGLITEAAAEFDGSTFYKLDAFSVSFSSMGETLQTVTVDGNDPYLARPADPVREGFVFLGWYDSMQGGELYDFGSVVYRNMTVYAHWEPASDAGEADPSVAAAGSGGSAMLAGTFLLGGGVCIAVVSLLFRRKSR